MNTGSNQHSVQYSSLADSRHCPGAKGIYVLKDNYKGSSLIRGNAQSKAHVPFIWPSCTSTFSIVLCLTGKKNLKVHIDL